MAFALGFPKDVTDRIYSMRDWRWEMVREGGKTPSRSCFDIRVPLPGEPCEKPLLFPVRMPYYYVESDGEDDDFGEIVIDHWNRDWPGLPRLGVCLEIYFTEPPKSGGGNPGEFHRLQLRAPYHVESDDGEADIGEIVTDFWHTITPLMPPLGFCSERHYLAGDFTLSKPRGRVPAKFRRLQRKLEKSTRDLWWQCDRCLP
jgi:hypothetical protein